MLKLDVPYNSESDESPSDLKLKFPKFWDLSALKVATLIGLRSLVQVEFRSRNVFKMERVQRNSDSFGSFG